MLDTLSNKRYLEYQVDNTWSTYNKIVATNKKKVYTGASVYDASGPIYWDHCLWGMVLVYRGQCVWCFGSRVLGVSVYLMRPEFQSTGVSVCFGLGFRWFGVSVYEAWGHIWWGHVYEAWITVFWGSVFIWPGVQSTGVIVYLAFGPVNLGVSVFEAWGSSTGVSVFATWCPIDFCPVFTTSMDLFPGLHCL